MFKSFKTSIKVRIFISDSSVFGELPFYTNVQQSCRRTNPSEQRQTDQFLSSQQQKNRALGGREANFTCTLCKVALQKQSTEFSLLIVVEWTFAENRKVTRKSL